VVALAKPTYSNVCHFCLARFYHPGNSSIILSYLLMQYARYYYDWLLHYTQPHFAHLRKTFGPSSYHIVLKLSPDFGISGLFLSLGNPPLLQVIAVPICRRSEKELACSKYRYIPSSEAKIGDPFTGSDRDAKISADP
jgi:hypothetical protein